MSSFIKSTLMHPMRPQAKAPAGAIPLPTTTPQPASSNPKVPAKPTNLNGRLGMKYILIFLITSIFC